jgi:muconate cycloisomerase
MKITGIEAIAYRLPIRRDFAWAGLNVGIGRFVLVRVYTDDGLAGVGEAVPLAEWGGDHNRRAGETQRTVIHVVEDLLAPNLVGEDPLDIERLVARMDAVVRGHSYAKAAVDMALHDLLGKAAGLPLYKVLGGAFRGSVPVAHMVGLMSAQDAIEEGAAAVADGVSALQVKGGVDPIRDQALIRGLRERLGPDVWLRLDVNQGYGDVASAVKILRAIEPAGLDFVEQPVAGVRQLAQVRRAVGVPIIADESCWDAQDALECVELEARRGPGGGGRRSGGGAPLRRERLDRVRRGQRGERALRARDAGRLAAVRDPCDRAYGDRSLPDCRPLLRRRRGDEAVRCRRRRTPAAGRSRVGDRDRRGEAGGVP